VSAAAQPPTDLNATDDDADVVDDEHADGCTCSQCSCESTDCGSWDREAAQSTRYRRGALIAKAGRQFRARRLTHHGAEPGRDVDDWEAVGPAPAAPPMRASAKAAKFAPPPWLRGLVEEIRTWTLETFARADRIAALERELASVQAKCAELEGRSGATATASALADAYAGVHVDGKHYARGQLVTFGGSLWLAMRDTTSRPARDETFRLIVKHGRDAKEAR
jgi:hypothetical protein